MGASIARKRTRLGPRVLRHQLAQVCASSCLMTCFHAPPWFLDTQSGLVHLLPNMCLRKSRYLKFRRARPQCVVLHTLVLMYSWYNQELKEMDSSKHDDRNGSIHKKKKETKKRGEREREKVGGESGGGGGRRGREEGEREGERESLVKKESERKSKKKVPMGGFCTKPHACKVDELHSACSWSNKFSQIQQKKKKKISSPLRPLPSPPPRLCHFTSDKPSHESTGLL